MKFKVPQIVIRQLTMLINVKLKHSDVETLDQILSV